MTDGVWDEGLETGNELLDCQHREFNALVNDLGNITGDSRAEMLRLLYGVTDFATDHFLAEEDLMRRVGYPPAAAERMVRQHEEFTLQIRLLVVSFRTGELLGLSRIRSFLEGTLRTHEFGEDRLLAEWIRGQGQASPTER